MTKRELCEDVFDMAFDEYKQLPDKAKEAVTFALMGGIISSMDAKLLLDESQYCQSPIEKIFLVAFDITAISMGCNDYLLLDIQYPIECENKEYFADFMFDTEEFLRDFYTPENDFKLVIECDGHKYHNSTKEQVAHDNERDFDLKMEGYEILHFSGRQIVRDPWKCAKEAIDLILSRIGEVKEGGNVEKWEKENGYI